MMCCFWILLRLEVRGNTLPDWVVETVVDAEQTPASPDADEPSPEEPLEAPANGVEFEVFELIFAARKEKDWNLFAFGKDGFAFMPDRRKPDEPEEEAREKKEFAPRNPRMLDVDRSGF
jgi:hypothetical protein